MVIYEIEDTKKLMNKLLRESAFDEFRLVTLEIHGLVTLSVDGLINTAFLSSDELEIQEAQINEHPNLAANLSHIQQYTKWGDYKPTVIKMIQGPKPPLAMKIQLASSAESAQALLDKVGDGELSRTIKSFNLNISYDQKAARIVTGTNYGQFVMNKAAENLFDQSIGKFLRKHDL